MARSKHLILTILVCGLLSIPMRASYGQTQTNQAATAAAQPAPCSSPEYRQLDFWVGDWDVYDAKGELQGHNLVQKILGGCALQEYYLDLSGLVASSFSIYDFTRKVWNQTYISTRGTLLPVEGYLQGKNMILMGMHVSPDDGRWAWHRMIWTPKDDGTAYQLWDFSRDGGKTWTVIYEAFLRKAKKPFPLKELQQRGDAMTDNRATPTDVKTEKPNAAK